VLRQGGVEGYRRCIRVEEVEMAERICILYFCSLLLHKKSLKILFPVLSLSDTGTNTAVGLYPVCPDELLPDFFLNFKKKKYAELLIQYGPLVSVCVNQMTAKPQSDLEISMSRFLSEFKEHVSKETAAITKKVNSMEVNLNNRLAIQEDNISDLNLKFDCVASNNLNRLASSGSSVASSLTRSSTINSSQQSSDEPMETESFIEVFTEMDQLWSLPMSVRQADAIHNIVVYRNYFHKNGFEDVKDIRLNI